MNKHYTLLFEIIVYLFIIGVIIFCFFIENLNEFNQIIAVLVIVSVVASGFLLLVFTELCILKKKQNVTKEIEMVEIIVYNSDETVDVGLYKSSTSDKND